MTYTIRPATLNDIPSLKQLETGLVNFERQFDPDIREGDNVWYYDLESVIKSQASVIFVAESQNQIVGCGMGTIKDF